MKIDLNFIRENGLIVYDVIYGSQAYGTNRPDSDKDQRGIFILPDSILKSIETVDGFVDKNYYFEINDGTQNVVYYELRKFLFMLSNSKPNVFEILNVPDDCIIYKHPIMDYLLNNKDRFVNKKCYYTFTDYVRSQLNKASGLNKMQNWESEKITRKTPMDFCYALIDGKSIPLFQYFNEKRIDPKFCGLTKTPNSRDVYALYYDLSGAQCFSELYDEIYRDNQKKWRQKKNFEMGKGYKGIQIDDSNEIRLSSIPKGETMSFFITYNKDGYSMHCKDYKRYQTWLKERDESRYTDFQSHGQGLDGKNMLHCRRLFEMCEEMAGGKGVIVRRPNAKELLKIREGEVSLLELKKYAEGKLESIKTLFQNSSLPEDIDKENLNDLLCNMRKQFSYEYNSTRRTQNISIDMGEVY